MAEKETGKQLNTKELFFNYTTEMACIAGFDGYFKELNPAWSRVLGWSTEELLSRPWNDFVHPDDVEVTESIKTTIVDGKEVFTFENRYICKDGTVKWLSWSSRPYPEEGIMFGVARDVTMLKNAEYELKKNEALLNEAQKITKLGSWNFDFRNDVLTWSDGLYDVFGVDRDTFKETHGSFLSLIDEDDRERSQKVSRHTQKTGEPFHILYRITTPKGERRQIEEYGFAEKDDLGNIVRLYGTAQDVTERIEIQEQMLNSDRIFRYASDMLCILGYDGFFKVVNPAWTKILGWSEEELLSKPYKDFVHPDDLNLTRHENERVLNGEGSLDFENRYLCKDGSYRWLSWKSFPFTKEQKVYAVVRDVTKQKEIAQGLVRLSTAVEQNPASIVITDLDGSIEYVNPAFTNLTGYTAEEARGANPNILKSGRQTADFYENLWKTITSGNVWKGEFHNRKKNGELYWERAIIAPVKGGDGNIINYLAIKEDITELREKTEKIEESELYHRSLIQTIPDMVIVFDKDGKFLDIKYSDEKNLMMTPSKFLGKSVEEIMPDEVTKQQMLATKQCLTEQTVVSFDYSLQLNGETRYFNSRNVAFGEDKVIATIRDITDYQENLDRIKQLLSTQEKQNEKLLNFTHIVSHNLRSHTANMQGILSLLKMDEPEIFNNPYVDLIKTSAENLNETIANLNEVLDMSFGEPDEKRSVNLHKTVDKAIKSISTLAQDAGVSLYNEIEEEIIVESIPAYLDSIVLNILTNGIKFHRPNVDSYVKVTCTIQDSFIAIAFEDNGVGVDLSLHREKLFHMYKTFHGHVESKGLGLFITKNQVEVMGGYIDVTSEVNKGTTFTIYLPHEEV